MQPKESSLPSDRFSSPSKKGLRGMKVEPRPTATPLHRGPAMARQASSEFIAKINDDRFLLRKPPSPNVTTIYLISVVLSQARHCSVKSHPFPSLSPLPSSDVRASMSFLSLSVPFRSSSLHSHHPIFSARTRICATGGGGGAATFIGQAGTILSFVRAQYEHRSIC